MLHNTMQTKTAHLGMPHEVSTESIVKYCKATEKKIAVRMPPITQVHLMQPKKNTLFATASDESIYKLS